MGDRLVRTRLKARRSGGRIREARGARRSAPLIALALLLLPTAVARPADLFSTWLQPGSRRAVGLGGDPYLSRVADEAGWWHASNPGALQGVRVEWQFNQTITEQASQGHGHLERQALNLWIAKETHLAGRRWDFAGRLARPSLAAKWNHNADQVRLNGEHVDGLLCLRGHDLLRGLDVQAAGFVEPENHGRLRRPAIGGRWSRGSWWAVQGCWQRGEDDSRLYSMVEENGVDTDLLSDHERTAWDARLSLPFGLQFEGSAQRGWIATRTQMDPDRRWQILPSGQDRFFEVSAVWHAPWHMRLLTRRTWGDARLSGNAISFGQRFGHLDYAEGSFHSTLVAVDRTIDTGTRWLVEMESAACRLRARADIEFWPFTETLIDLLGPRRIARAAGEASWTRWHAAGETMFGRGLRARAGLSWIDLRGNCHFESWRPAFLVFGRADYRRESLAYRGAQIGSLAIGVELARRWGTLRFGLEQVAFVRPLRRSASSDTHPEDPDLDQDLAGMPWSQRLPGGSEILLSYERSW